MRSINTRKELLEYIDQNPIRKVILCNNEQFTMIMKSLKKVIKMIKAYVGIDNTIDIDILSELVNDIEKDNNIPTLEESKIC